jgi:hypothetical protein
MSIQDDIFDIQHALKNKPEAKAFKKLWTYLYDLEEAVECLRKVASPVFQIARLVKEINEDESV